ncbi:hypothetical protein PM082_021831 [Marasmius tenuissimus]|nr:hypothetical protein PM082_021831 [Marasmius tenuissimus]
MKATWLFSRGFYSSGYCTRHVYCTSKNDERQSSLGNTKERYAQFLCKSGASKYTAQAAAGMESTLLQRLKT